MSRRVLSIILAFSALLVGSAALAADAPASYPLADRVPADAFVYFGWQGADEVGPGMTSTHLHAVLAQSRIEDVFRDFAPRAIEKFISPKNAQASQIMQSALTGLGVLWRHPTAIYVSGISVIKKPEGGLSMQFKGAVVCRAGADAAALKQSLAPEVDAANADHWPARIVDDGDLTIEAFGYGDNDPILAPAGDASKSLSSADSFKSATAALSVKPVLGGFVDVQKLAAEIRALSSMDDATRTQFDQVLTAMGVAGVHTVSGAAGFDGSDWMTESFIAAPSPRTGLFAAESGAAISDDLLKHVPKSATSVFAGKHDLEQIVKQIRDGLKKVNPKAGAAFNAGLGAIQLATAIRPLQDILAPLGPDWATYMSDDVGDGIAGLIIVNKLRDPATAAAKYPLLQSSICNLASVFLRHQQMMLSSGTMSAGDVTVNYFDTPFASPSWAIKDGYLYLGLYPQAVGSALRHSAEPSILEEPKFKAVMSRLGDKPALALTYVDLPQEVGAIYNALLIYERVGAGLAAMHGVQVTEPVIPPYDILMANLAPAGSVAWADDAGIHGRTVSPFPGASEMAFKPQMGIAVPALMTSILLPSLSRAREAAGRVKCAQNERQIGLAILLWCNDHKGQYPPDLAALVQNEEITAATFLCPDDEVTVPNNLATMTPDQIGQWVNEHSSYIYYGKDLTQDKAGADTVVLSEKPGDHGDDGVNILFGDGHVEFVNMQRAETIIPQH